ncbi:MAG: hypothetical protein ACLVAW_26370 [Eisenbergiella massiliensis]
MWWKLLDCQVEVLSLPCSQVKAGGKQLEEPEKSMMLQSYRIVPFIIRPAYSVNVLRLVKVQD